MDTKSKDHESKNSDFYVSPEPKYYVKHVYDINFMLYQVKNSHTNQTMSTWISKSDAEDECLSLNGGINGCLFFTIPRSHVHKKPK